MAKGGRNKGINQMVRNNSKLGGATVGEMIGAKMGMGDRGRQIGRKVGNFLGKAATQDGKQRRKLVKGFKSVKKLFKK